MVHHSLPPFRHRPRLLFASGILLLSALVGCEGNNPPAQVPASVAVAPTSVALHAIGAVRQASAAVLDQQGDTIRSEHVVWTSLGPSVATVDSTGKITALAVGTAQIQAAASSNANVTTLVPVTVTQVPAQLAKISGDGQSAMIGTTLPLPLTVRVNDSASAAVPGVIVAFAVTQGDATVTAADTTAGDGLAFATLQLGMTAGTDIVSVAVPGTGVSLATFTATATGAAPATMVIQAGDGQTAHVGTAVATPPAVLLQDAFNNPVTGVVVTFAVASGGGVLTKAVDTTGTNGIAAPTAWFLGSVGTNTLTASVSEGGVSGNPVTFTATGTAAGAATQVVVDTGDGQTGLAGYALNVAPAVRVLDAANGPVSGVSVDFAVLSGGGGVTGATATTNLFGVASVGSWTVQLGSNSLSATVTGLTPVTFTATGASPQYNIDVQVVGTLTPPEQAAFDSAKAKWERLIYGDVPDINISPPIAAGQCGTGSPAISGFIDDIRIFAIIDSIDGPGKILGEAGPCVFRLSNDLPVVGIMHFDSADVAGLLSAGVFDEVILHEMGHVLGFGTIWEDLGLLIDPRRLGGTDPHFVGAQALARFDTDGGASYSLGAKVPVENCANPPPGTACGVGQYDGHWRETTFENELMTPYISNGPSPLSAITTASMGDMGYQVNYAGSDGYAVANPLALTRPGGGTGIVMHDDILHIPVLVVDDAGRVVKVIPPR